MPSQKPLSALRLLIILLLSLGSFFLVFSYLASDYPSFIGELLISVRRPNRMDDFLADSRLLFVYKALKYLLFFGLLFFFFCLYNACVRKQGRLSGWLDRITTAIWSVFSLNKTYWRQLDPFAKKGLFFIGAIQFVFFLFFLLDIPYHYDEAWSYVHFSGVGFVQTATFYPLPNNHIFYNLVSRLFCFLPFPAEVGTRLPSFFASLVATWYFFKLAHTYFSAAVALFVTILFTAAFPVILYSVVGRGYGFLICFTVLLFYAADHFTGLHMDRKYRLLYISAMTAGLYTIPSFLFTVLATGGIIGCYDLLRKQWRLLWMFFLDNAIAGLAVLVLYAPVVHFNGLAVLSNPNGSAHLALHSMIPLILPHLSSTFNYLLGTSGISLGWILIPLVLSLLSVRTPAGRQCLLPWLAAGTLLSPLVLLCLFPIIPFERSWVYLAVPLALSIGFMLTMFTGFAKSLPDHGSLRQRWTNWRQPVLISLYAGMLVLLFANFRKLHRRDYAIDYDIRTHFEKLGADIDHIRTIGFTGPSLQYYVAEDLIFQCYKRNPQKQVIFRGRDSFHGFDDDVLIVAPDSVASFKLDNYEFIGRHDNIYSIFIRKNK
jgi:hypothetical protein